ncbi:MAG: Mismatch repair ATPase (MutS family) [Firmicutes bacterium]|nr:Mismatch repair ATPase (MutS family) [Bacillota bacterium]
MFNQEIIRQARQTNLSSFLQSRGEPLKQLRGKTNEWQHCDHDSLYIRENMFYWFSHERAGCRDINNEWSGNSLSFVMKYYGWDFKTAVSELTGATYTPTKLVINATLKPQQQPDKFKPPAEGKNINRVIAYLTKTRKINYETVKKCLVAKILSVDEYNNAVFKIYDENGNMVGAEKTGTLTAKRFKQIVTGSKYGYGFTVKCGKKPTKLYCFESPIDTLSYYDLFHNQLNDAYLISLAGVKEQTITDSIDRYDIDYHNVWVCTDNDDVGREFAERMAGTYRFNVHLPPDGFKDWNEVLARQK